jgi:N-acyl-D-aspartate/D-glutamate deacylase
MPARLPPSAKSRIVASREFKARGLLVTPGFVDPHTHYDGQVEQSHHF